MRKALVATMLACAILTATSNTVSNALSTVWCQPVARPTLPDPVGRF